MFRMFNLLFAPNDVGGAPAPTPEINKEDAIKFFEDDDEQEESLKLDKDAEDSDKRGRKSSKTKETESEEESEETEESEDEDENEDDDEEVDDLKELEDEVEEPTEEDLELVSPVRRKEILAKYPKLFKDFPYLEKAYYREQQFTEVFPTIDDAKTAQTKAQALEGFEQELRSGNIENILSVVAKHDRNAFNKTVDTYIDTLMKVDEKAGYHVIGNLVKDTIVSLVKAGRAQKDDSLIEAAKVLNKFMFATEEFEPKARLASDDDGKEKPEDRVAQRERQLIRRQIDATSTELNTRVENILTKTIELNIDPRDSMTPFIKKNATREALETVTSMIEKDTRFKVILDKLWNKVIQGDFKKADIDRVKEAYTSKAKTLLPSVIKKARQEALKGMGKRTREAKPDVEETETEETTPRQKKTRESTPSSNRGQDDREKARKIPANVSTRDFLMSD